jgi:hypothetical protein
MHEARQHHDPQTTPSKPAKPGPLSQSDPRADDATRRRPPVVLVVVVVVLVIGFVVLHLTGVVGPSGH